MTGPRYFLDPERGPAKADGPGESAIVGLFALPPPRPVFPVPRPWSPTFYFDAIAKPGWTGADAERLSGVRLAQLVERRGVGLHLFRDLTKFLKDQGLRLRRIAGFHENAGQVGMEAFDQRRGGHAALARVPKDHLREGEGGGEAVGEEASAQLDLNPCGRGVFWFLSHEGTLKRVRDGGQS